MTQHFHSQVYIKGIGPTDSKTGNCTPWVIAVLVKVALEPTLVSIHGRMDEPKEVNTYNGTCFSLKKQWMKFWHLLQRGWNLENNTLNARNQTQKDKYCMILLMWTKTRQIHRDWKWHGGGLESGDGEWELLCNCVEFLSGMATSSANRQWWWLHNIMNVFNTTELYT